MALECSMCRQKRKLFGGASLAACELCADVICTRCRSDKKVFEMDVNMILGKFRKLAACKSCILETNRTLSQPHEPQMLIVMSEHLQLDREDRRRRGASSSGSSGTRSRSSSSCPSTPSEECSRASRLHCRGKNESVTSSASTVSSRSYQACQLVYTVNEEHMELQQQGQANAIKPSHRIQQFGSSQRAQQQLTPKPQAVVVSRSHRDCALRRVASTGSTFTCSSSRDRDAYSYATAPSSQPNDLFARMVELNRLAESTYNTTQQNGVYLSQQMRSRRRT
ncbi:hypothetical protein PC128_g20505 [Phytophthora cactorum]|nr:hypothetical protein PC128_g20505 [Phytophthora cactorum]